MDHEGLDVLVAFSPENINYLTGHDTPAYQYLQACVVTARGTPVNLLRSIDASNTLFRSWNRAAAIYQDNEDPIAILAEIIASTNGATRVGLERDAFFVGASRYNRLVRILSETGRIVLEQSIVEDMRLIKSPAEIEKLRSAAAVTTAAMSVAVDSAAEGIDENEIAGAVWTELVRHGGEFPGLPPFIVSGPRTSLGHATWSGRKLVRGDSVAFEIPGVVGRYAAPLFRSGVIGEKSNEIARLESAVLESLDLLLTNIRPDIPCEDIHRLSYENFARRGFHLTHRSGYSVGVNYAPDWGEGHLLSIQEGEKRKLEKGMVFHVVPGIFVPRKHMVGISETVVVTENGCECLTTFPRAVFVAPDRAGTRHG